MIHAAYRLWGGDGFYAKMLGTSMLSMFENTKEKVTIHIMHNERLTPDNRDKFCYIADQYNQQVKFHNVEEISGSTLRKFEAAYPIPSGVNASWYPLIIHEVFPHLDKIIFLGADILFNLDVAELWAYDLNDCGFAAVPDQIILPKEATRKLWAPIPLVEDNSVRYEDYFCADLMVMNPEFFRENFERILDACKFMHDNNYPFFEQDTLNYLFSSKYKKLPIKFNTSALYYRYLSSLRGYLRVEKAIYHFSGKSVDFNVDDALNRIYLNYFLKTPWATADMFGNLNKAMKKTFGQILNDSRNMMLNVTNLLSERRRAFLVDESFIEEAKQIFAIKPNEPVISLSTDAKNFLQKLNDSKGEILLFVLSDDYWKIRLFLISKNFVEGTDFVNGALFLSERHGVKFNLDTKEIVQAI